MKVTLPGRGLNIRASNDILRTLFMTPICWSAIGKLYAKSWYYTTQFTLRLVLQSRERNQLKEVANTGPADESDPVPPWLNQNFNHL